MLTEAVRLLSGPWLGTEERLQTVGWRLLPLLVVSSSSQLSLVSCIGHSSIMAQQPLTQNWAKGETEPGLILPQLSCKLFPVLKPTDEAATKTLLPNIFICGDMMQINHQPASPVFCSKRVVHELLDFPQPLSNKTVSCLHRAG